MNDENPIEPGQEWTVDLMRPEDAPGVAALFRSVYGDAYPIRAYLEPDLLTAENQAGTIISSVARTPRGDIVGHNALFNSAPYSGTFESGAGLVHRDYRGGHGIFTRMVAHGLEAGRDKGVEQAFGEPVCNHPISQKLGHTMGFTVRAVEIGLMPATAYSKEASAVGRVTTLLHFSTLKPGPCDVHVPGAYQDLFPLFYADMDDRRRFLPSGAPLPAETPTRLTTRTFPFAQVARVAVPEPGHDFEAVITDREARLLAQGIRVIQVWISTGVPWAGSAVDILRARGYFFGGVLPRWFDCDGLLMERILDEPDWEAMVLYHQRSRDLTALIRADWEQSLTATRRSQHP
jgi:hypothetical protein